MKYFMLIILTSLLLSCKDDNALIDINLEEYIVSNEGLELADLVACAGGKMDGLLGDESEPTDIFFYPIQGAADFKYFEARNIADSIDYSKYIEKELDDTPMFNGYLWKFNNESFADERMGIVTYKTPGKIHICNPIRLKTNIKPTEVNSDLLDVFENGLTPSFSWMDGDINENVIYFQVISDSENNFISGTYTIEKEFTFYDLSNVVFNITDSTTTPILESNQDYKFTMMGVSEDNWVNLFIEKEFYTD